MIIDRINSRIDAVGTNPAKVGDATGGRSRVYDILKGKSRNPGIDTVKAIATNLDTTVAYLIGETDDPAANAALRKSLPAHPLEVAGMDVVADSHYVELTVRVVFPCGPDGECESLRLILAREGAIVLRHDLDEAIPGISKQSPSTEAS